MLEAYTDVREELKTGDVGLFSGKGRVSELIKWGTSSPYSHAGLIYVDPLHNVFLVHSTSIGSQRDYMSGRRGVKGLQMSLLSQVLKHDYGGRCVVCRVKSVFRVQGSAKRAEANNLMWRDLRRRIPYDTVQAIGAGIDWWDRFYENEEDWSALFCSEWVALDHKRCGWLDDSVNASEQTPADILGWSHLESPCEVKL